MTYRIKTAFYPCCAGDFIEPRRLLSSFVDEIIFCDIRKHSDWDRLNDREASPKVSLVIEDVREYIDKLKNIDVFFHRSDSEGEGGSGIHFLSPRMLARIVALFPKEGGLIITDGSNSGGHIYKKMLRPGGYFRKEWGLLFKLEQDQPSFKKRKLQLIRVTPQK